MTNQPNMKSLRTKREYTKPAMQVYEMKQWPQLLQMSTNAELDVTYFEEDWQ